jgi:hypothetical protein
MLNMSSKNLGSACEFCLRQVGKIRSAELSQRSSSSIGIFEDFHRIVDSIILISQLLAKGFRLVKLTASIKSSWEALKALRKLLKALEILSERSFNLSLPSRLSF